MEIIKTYQEIDGLRLEQNWRIDNGKDSFVIPFPTTNPFNLVFHGEQKFEYGHYGIHLGQEDRLTFLGNPEQFITAYFIDCRVNSKTKGNRLVCQYSPSSDYCLCIPPGVAHAFEGLENIFTINSYKLFLPEPNKWLSGESQWDINNDVINLPMDVKDDDLLFFEPNNQSASEVFYELIREHQANNIPNIDTEYPFTEDINFSDGTNARLMFKKKESKSVKYPEWEPINQIDGLGWKRHLVYWSGEHSGFIPFLETSPYYVVDHGFTSYTHDAFGIHIGQQDRLTFIGDPNQLVKVTFVDCREDSKTLHKEVTVSFYPTALRFLVIPNGVAHRFEDLHKVFTINRPIIYSDDIVNYQPGNDVIDWDIKRKDYPSYKVSSKEAPINFYKEQANSQTKLMSTPPKHSTPIILQTQTEDGEIVKVAIRKNE
jgi:dTDP-4-dehydrorhamnose 3,5-epimerase-like enzyme